MYILHISTNPQKPHLLPQVVQNWTGLKAKRITVSNLKVQVHYGAEWKAVF